METTTPTPNCVKLTGGLADQPCWCGACFAFEDEPEDWYDNSPPERIIGPVFPEDVDDSNFYDSESFGPAS
jgi:hypothetical protein